MIRACYFGYSTGKGGNWYGVGQVSSVLVYFCIFPQFGADFTSPRLVSGSGILEETNRASAVAILKMGDWGEKE